jgi:hypothetical protein
MRATLLATAAALGVGLTGGCPGEIENPELFIGGGPCPNIEGDLFPRRCGTQFCHTPGDLAGMLDLVSPDVGSRLVGVPATSAGCGMETLANPADPQNSVLYLQLTEDHCGPTQMPVGAPLTEREIECVAEYIAAFGAVGSGGAGGSGGGGVGGEGGEGGAGAQGGGGAGGEGGG